VCGSSPFFSSFEGGPPAMTLSIATGGNCNDNELDESVVVAL